LNPGGPDFFQFLPDCCSLPSDPERNPLGGQGYNLNNKGGELNNENR